MNPNWTLWRFLSPHVVDDMCSNQPDFNADVGSDLIDRESMSFGGGLFACFF